MSMSINRREFLQKGTVSLSVLSAAGLCGCTCNQVQNSGKIRSTCCATTELEPESLSFREKSLVIDLSKALSLQGKGDSVYILDPDKNIQIILVHESGKHYYALSRLCTHGNQVIGYNRTRGLLQCNNYNHSLFELNGEVVKGPAEIPLKSYSVTLGKGTLEIAL